MTRLALLADIHGNLPALEAVLADIERLDIERIVVAGDLINWGPFSAAVLARLAALEAVCIRGNNEYYLLDYGTPRQPAAWHEYNLLPWLYEQLGADGQRAIACWPDELVLLFPDAPALRLFHGAPGDPWRSLQPRLPATELATLLADVPEPTVVAAHSHLPLARRVRRWQLINPGSVGVPLDGRPGVATFALLEGEPAGWRVEHRHVAWELEAVLAEFARQRFVERYGIVARLLVEEFRCARLRVHPFNVWRQECCPGAPLTELTLARFRAADIWRYTPPEYHLNRD